MPRGRGCAPRPSSPTGRRGTALRCRTRRGARALPRTEGRGVGRRRHRDRGDRDLRQVRRRPGLDRRVAAEHEAPPRLRALGGLRRCGTPPARDARPRAERRTPRRGNRRLLCIDLRRHAAAQRVRPERRSRGQLRRDARGRRTDPPVARALRRRDLARRRLHGRDLRPSRTRSRGASRIRGHRVRRVLLGGLRERARPRAHRPARLHPTALVRCPAGGDRARRLPDGIARPGRSRRIRRPLVGDDRRRGEPRGALGRGRARAGARTRSSRRSLPRWPPRSLSSAPSAPIRGPMSSRGRRR